MKQKHLIYIVIGVIVSWILIPAASMLFYGIPDSSATFGDTFGVINALFSSLAFALLIYTAWMQKEELSLQRKEMKLTRDELKRSSEAQNLQSQFAKQQFELNASIRRTQIRPRFVFISSEWRYDENLGDEIFFVILEVSENPIRVMGVDLSGSDKFFSCTHIRPIILQVGEKVNLSFVHVDGLNVIPPASCLQINFCDQDGNMYNQRMIMSSTKCLLVEPNIIIL